MTLSNLKTGNRLLGFKYGSLLGTSVMDQISSNYGHSTIGKPHGNLAEILQSDECGNLPVLSL